MEPDKGVWIVACCKGALEPPGSVPSDSLGQRARDG